MADKGWQRVFDDPIPLPDGRTLVTLRDGNRSSRQIVPKSERNMPAVTTAAEMLTYAARRDWPTNQGADRRRDETLHSP
jgi:hypothetical protein